MLISHRNGGFSLLEVMIALGLTAVVSSAILGWSVHFQHSIRQQQAKQEAEQALHHWLHWLWRDLQTTLAQQPNQWQYRSEEQCLLYGDVGVRIKANKLQWRPEQAACDSRGWQALNDPSKIRLTKLHISSEQLCLEGRAAQLQPTKVCLPWPL